MCWYVRLCWYTCQIINLLSILSFPWRIQDNCFVNDVISVARYYMVLMLRIWLHRIILEDLKFYKLVIFSPTDNHGIGKEKLPFPKTVSPKNLWIRRWFVYLNLLFIQFLVNIKFSHSMWSIWYFWLFILI